MTIVIDAQSLFWAALPIVIGVVAARVGLSLFFWLKDEWKDQKDLWKFLRERRAERRKAKSDLQAFLRSRQSE